jgi:hypothetical protein
MPIPCRALIAGHWPFIHSLIHSFTHSHGVQTHSASSTPYVELSGFLHPISGRFLTRVNRTVAQFQIKAMSPEHAAEIVQGAQSEELDRLMIERGFRLQHALARKLDHNATVTPRGMDIYSSIGAGVGGPGGASAKNGVAALSARNNASDPLAAPFRNGYSLTRKYETQLNGTDPEAHAKSPSTSSTMLL